MAKGILVLVLCGSMQRMRLAVPQIRNSAACRSAQPLSLAMAMKSPGQGEFECDVWYLPPLSHDTYHTPMQSRTGATAVVEETEKAVYMGTSCPPQDH